MKNIFLALILTVICVSGCKETVKCGPNGCCICGCTPKKSKKQDGVIQCRCKNCKNCEHCTDLAVLSGA